MRGFAVMLCLLTAGCVQPGDGDLAVPVTITRTSQDPVVAEPGADLEISFLIEAAEESEGSPAVSLALSDATRVSCAATQTTLSADPGDGSWSRLAGSFDCVCLGTEEGATDYVLTVTNGEGQPTARGSVTCVEEVVVVRAALIASTAANTLVRIGVDGELGTTPAEGAFDVLTSAGDTLIACGEDPSGAPACEQSIDAGSGWFRALPGLERVRAAVYMDPILMYLATEAEVFEAVACSPESILEVSPATIVGVGFTTWHGCMVTTAEGGALAYLRSPGCTTDWSSDSTSLGLSGFVDQEGVLVAVDDEQPAVMVSTDAGDTWLPTSGLPSLVAPLDVVATPDGGFLAAFDEAVYRSDDGATWSLHTDVWPGGTLEWSPTAAGWFSLGATGIAFSSDAVSWAPAQDGSFLGIVGQ